SRLPRSDGSRASAARNTRSANSPRVAMVVHSSKSSNWEDRSSCCASSNNSEDTGTPGSIPVSAAERIETGRRATAGGNSAWLLSAEKESKNSLQRLLRLSLRLYQSLHCCVTIFLSFDWHLLHVAWRKPGEYPRASQLRESCYLAAIRTWLAIWSEACCWR